MEERDDHTLAIEWVVKTHSANKHTLKTNYGVEGKDVNLLFSIEWYVSWDGGTKTLLVQRMLESL